PSARKISTLVDFLVGGRGQRVPEKRVGLHTLHRADHDLTLELTALRAVDLRPKDERLRAARHDLMVPRTVDTRPIVHPARVPAVRSDTHRRLTAEGGRGHLDAGA